MRYLVEDLSLRSLKLPNAYKKLRKLSRQREISNSPFEGATHWDTNETRVWVRMSRCCSPKISHHIYGNQANNSTKTNIDHSFKNTKVKVYHLKVVPPKKISLSYPQCFNVSRVHPLVRTLSPTNLIPEVSLAGRLNLYYFIGSNVCKI